MDKGVLQLLFDQRFLRDVLLGGRPLAAVAGATATTTTTSSSSSTSGHLVSPGAGGSGFANGSFSGAGGGAGGGGLEGAVDPDLAAELSQRKREVAQLEQQLQVSTLLCGICEANINPKLFCL